MGTTRLSIFFLLLVARVMTSPEGDKIISLPGLTHSINFEQYAGYLKTHTGKMLFYWLVESQKSPSTDPLVLWMNGGPGCSSLAGNLEENGPFRIDSNGEKLINNPQSWNKVANVLYLEGPAGVGFSYSNTSNYTIDDDQMADDNLWALKDFYEKFPEYHGREFFITGESYAGVYIPTLASRVIDDPTFNFKGFAVGNGQSDSTINNNSMVYFAYYHGLISSKVWNEMLLSCCPGNDKSRCPFAQTAKTNKKCENLLSLVEKSTSGLDVYNIYKECVGRVAVEGEQFDSSSASSRSHSHLPRPMRNKPQAGIKADMSDAYIFPCGTFVSSEIYLNQPDVRKALHIPDTVKYWSFCSNTLQVTYIPKYDNVYKEYVKVLEKRARILVYNGDMDIACNFLGAEWFVNSLPLKVVADQRPWHYLDESGNTQVAGQIQEFEQLKFVTIKGSGHFVATEKPIQALDMFSRFLNDEPYW